MLARASEVAYGEGTSGLVKIVGPSGGLTRLADVFLEDLTETKDCANIALQWDAISADGKLFTALLAHLKVSPAGDQATTLSLTGTYWAPPGVEPGRTMMRSYATAVVESFLDSVACEFAHPAGTSRQTH